VVRPFTERWVVEGDKPFVNDSCFTMITPRSEVLPENMYTSVNQPDTEKLRVSPHDNQDDNTATHRVRTS
jgi:hypothetical protein